MLTKLFNKGKEEAQGVQERLPLASTLDLSIDVASPSESHSQVVAPIVAVLGAKGGVGASTLAVNLATAIAAGGTATTIVDANFQQPDVAQLCGQDPRHSVTELMSRSNMVDQRLFEACAIETAQPRLSLLSPPLNGEAGARSNLSQLTDCLNNIRHHSSFWIVDLPRHLDKHLVTLTDVCDKIVLVFEATLPGVAASQRWLAIFRELGYDSERIVCVLNRAGSKYSGVEQQLSTCFADQTIFRIPNASTVAWECETRGTPVLLSQPGHSYSRAVTKLAKHIYSSIPGRSA
jgi:pilus assembly protein CpaE